MLKNYFKIALRHITKNKGFSILNMLGLSLGLTCAILIMLWIQDEVSYNKFHKKYDVLHRVMENQTYEGKIYTFGATPGLLASSMKAEIPEVKNATRMGWGERWLFSLNDKPIYENGNYVDPDFFNMFSFDFIYGSPSKALLNDRSIVITEKMSRKFFGEQNPVGKYLKANDKNEFLITGVVKDPPLNSTIQFSWLASFKIFETENDWWQSWGNNSMQTFVELKPLTALANFNKKISKYIKSKNTDSNAEPVLLPMKDWRLRSAFEDGKQVGGRIEYVRLFGVIALILIVIACINFMNLATARSDQRSKEVGVRKVMGAQRSTLMTQFISESVVMSLVSTIVACLLVILFLPLFNDLVGKKLSLGLRDPTQWIILLSIALFCGIIAGSYPSIYLSSFKPISIFRGFRKNGSSAPALIRKGLVVTQFVISIIMIISTVVIYKQISHVKKRNLGFSKDNLLYVHQKGQINSKLKIIEEDLISTGVVSNAAGCNQTVIQIGNNTSGISWEGKDPTKDILITTDFVGSDYINTIGMKLINGRDFYKNNDVDSTTVIVNETFAKLLNKKDPINAVIRWDTTDLTVIGVVKDFIFNDMYKPADPVVIFCYPKLTSNLFIRLKKGDDLEGSLAKIEKVLGKHNPGYPFEYNFLDEDFDKQFRSEMLVSKLSSLFAVITIVISCLGLFGLAAYTAERRTKEIGIRKVLGATVQNVISLLSKDFVKLVLIAVIIASPVAWYIMSQWLQDYAYRINIQWWVFVVAGSAALLIALFTVSFQAIKAAIANPVKSLRAE
jgi:putative ABC transport system permease protein